MNAADLILGIDGGGTKTVAWLAERNDRGHAPEDAVEDVVVGRGTGGPSNPLSAGLDAALENLEAAIAAAFSDADIAPSKLAAACLGIAGAGRQREQTAILRWAQARALAHQTQVVHDAVPVLHAGTPEGWGVALVSGTGSFAFGTNAQGETARAGGWGPLLGDEGSGYAIAAAGLRAAARAADGRGPLTALLDRFLETFGTAVPIDLITAVHAKGISPDSIASHADVVLQAAADGDDVARSIIADAGKDLAEMVTAIVRRLDLVQAPVPLALAGGILVHHGELREALQRHLSHRIIEAQPTTTVPHPVRGAVKFAQGLVS